MKRGWLAPRTRSLELDKAGGDNGTGRSAAGQEDLQGRSPGALLVNQSSERQVCKQGGGGSPEALVEGNLGLLITVWPGAAWPTVVGECVNISITIAH